MTAILKAVNPQAKPELLRLNLGCGRNILPGWVNVDCVELPGVDLVQDLNNMHRNNGMGMAAWDVRFTENCVDQFLLSHTLEHIHNTLPLMQELYRIAKPDALCVIRTPYGSSDDAWEDPTHVRAYFIGSWGYFSQPYYWRADYQYRGDWQADSVELVVKKELLKLSAADDLLARVHRERNIVVEMIATLRAVKPIREPKRELQVAPKLKFVVLP